MATELPSKYLPAVGYSDLPEPQRLTKYLGASVIILVTALGSGELIIWPYITSQVGMGLLWLAVVGFSMQFFLNMEITRYTLATGETDVTGFSRFWKPWGIIFALGAILPNFWPGWAASGARLFTFLFGLGDGAVPWIAAVQLFAIALAISAAPVVYQLLEKLDGVLVAIVMVFLVIAIIIATDASSWVNIAAKAPEGVSNMPRYLTELGPPPSSGQWPSRARAGQTTSCRATTCATRARA